MILGKLESLLSNTRRGYSLQATFPCAGKTLCPDTGYGFSAVFALSAPYIDLANHVSGPLYNHFPASRAEGVLSLMPWNVSNIHIVECGDYSKGIARIKCTNPECGYEFFRPFSCKSWYLCPSCDPQDVGSAGEDRMSKSLLIRKDFCFSRNIFQKTCS